VHTRFKYKTSLCLVVSCAASVAAYGQEIESSETAAKSDQGLQEVVVTASKTGAQSVQLTPIAISAFTSDQLSKSNLATIQDLQGYVPNLSISQSTTYAEIYIRGIGSSNFIGGSDPSTTVQVDGIYLSRPYAQFADFLDVERVEVLRGPQGTLYGRNAVGGTINVISRQPTDEFMAENQISVGDFSLFKDQAYVSGPIVRGELQGSLSVSYTSHGPYIDNIVPGGSDISDEHTRAIRGQLRFEPTDYIDATTRMDYMVSRDAQGMPTTLLAPFDPVTSSILGDFTKVATNTPEDYRTTNSGIAEDITVRLNDALKLRSLTAFRTSSTEGYIDADATDQNLLAGYQAEHDHQVSQEVNLAGNYNHFNFVTGVYYLHEKDTLAITASVIPAGVAAVYLPTFNTDAEALFAQGTYHVTDQVHLTVGGRYTWEQKDMLQNGGVYLNPLGQIYTGQPSNMLRAVPASFDLSSDYHAPTPKFGVQWTPADNLMLYASATRGFKSGGYNFSSDTASTAAFAPEKVWSYEVGLKSSWLDHRLRANLTGFYYDYTNLQVQEIIGPAEESITNAATATNKGLELEVAARPVPGLDLIANIATLDATYSKYLGAPVPASIGGGVTDASGKRLDQAPSYSGNVAAEYTLQLSRGDSVDGRAEYNFQGREYFEPTNYYLESQKDYGTLNIAVGYTTAGGAWRLSLWSKNLADKHYFVAIGDNGATFSGVPGAPRIFGATLTTRW
jgi:iron complex outermembrane recepter protein